MGVVSALERPSWPAVVVASDAGNRLATSASSSAVDGVRVASASAELPSTAPVLSATRSGRSSTAEAQLTAAPRCGAHASPSIKPALLEERPFEFPARAVTVELLTASVVVELREFDMGVEDELVAPELMLLL